VAARLQGMWLGCPLGLGLQYTHDSDNALLLLALVCKGHLVPVDVFHDARNKTWDLRDYISMGLLWLVLIRKKMNHVRSKFTTIFRFSMYCQTWTGFFMCYLCRVSVVDLRQKMTILKGVVLDFTCFPLFCPLSHMFTPCNHEIVLPVSTSTWYTLPGGFPILRCTWYRLLTWQSTILSWGRLLPD
jgi:hypothetical protein